MTDYLLATFGGAGGQHACHVADALVMQTPGDGGYGKGQEDL